MALSACGNSNVAEDWKNYQQQHIEVTKKFAQKQAEVFVNMSNMSTQQSQDVEAAVQLMRKSMEESLQDMKSITPKTAKVKQYHDRWIQATEANIHRAEALIRAQYNKDSAVMEKITREAMEDTKQMVEDLSKLKKEIEK